MKKVLCAAILLSFSVCVPGSSHASTIWTFDVLELAFGLSGTGFVPGGAFCNISLAGTESRFGVGTAISRGYLIFPVCLYYYPSIGRTFILKETTVVGPGGNNVPAKTEIMTFRPLYLCLVTGTTESSNRVFGVSAGYRISSLFSVECGGFSGVESMGGSFTSVPASYLILKLHLGWQWKEL